jgi:hypothetical protein
MASPKGASRASRNPSGVLGQQRAKRHPVAEPACVSEQVLASRAHRKRGVWTKISTLWLIAVGRAALAVLAIIPKASASTAGESEDLVTRLATQACGDRGRPNRRPDDKDFQRLMASISVERDGRGRRPLARPVSTAMIQP